MMPLHGRGWRLACRLTTREDQFGDLRSGSRLELLPANGDGRIEAPIAEIIPRGEFATWRASRAVGDHDLDIFLVRADPVGPVLDLQPGMSVWLKPAGRTVQ